MIFARTLRFSAVPQGSLQVPERIVAGASRIVEGTSVFERLPKFLEDL